MISLKLAYINQAGFKFTGARIKGVCHLTQLAIFFNLTDSMIMY